MFDLVMISAKAARSVLWKEAVVVHLTHVYKELDFLGLFFLYKNLFP